MSLYINESLAPGAKPGVYSLKNRTLKYLVIQSSFWKWASNNESHLHKMH